MRVKRRSDAQQGPREGELTRSRDLRLVARREDLARQVGSRAGAVQVREDAAGGRWATEGGTRGRRTISSTAAAQPRAPRPSHDHSSTRSLSFSRCTGFALRWGFDTPGSLATETERHVSAPLRAREAFARTASPQTCRSSSRWAFRAPLAHDHRRSHQSHRTRKTFHQVSAQGALNAPSGPGDNRRSPTSLDGGRRAPRDRTQ